MTQYINYSQMNSSERNVFNKTGECPSVYLMSEGEYEEQLMESIKNDLEVIDGVAKEIV